MNLLVRAGRHCPVQNYGGVAELAFGSWGGGFADVFTVILNGGALASYIVRRGEKRKTWRLMKNSI